MAVLTASIPVSLAYNLQLPNRLNLATSLGLYLAVGSHHGVLTNPRSEFGLRLP